jgi:hypothetical protein
LAIAGMIAWIAPARSVLSRLLDRLRSPAPAERARIAVLVAVVAGVYLAGTAYYHGRELYPRLHDECSYEIGAHMLAQGRLWMPQHPLADFFESFHLLVKPVYCSIYFPGTALLNAPGVWLGLPTWIFPTLLAALAVALAYRVSAELIDGITGLLVALLMIATPQFRIMSTMVLSQVPAMVMGLLMVWAWLRWRQQMRPLWALAIGAFAGWAAITRPVDAIAFALPVGIAMALRLLGWRLSAAGAPIAGTSAKDELAPVRAPAAPGNSPTPRDQSIPVWLRNAGMLLAGALPFLLLQLVFNLGVTGRPLMTPYQLYLEQSQPGSVFGTGAVAKDKPLQSSLPQKQVYYRWLLSMENQEHAQGRLMTLREEASQTLSLTLPADLLVWLIPLGWLGWAARGRWVFFAAAPLFLLLYQLNPFFLPHYVMPLTAALAGCAAMGVRAAQDAWPRRRGFIGVFLVQGVAFVALASLPELNPKVRDAFIPMPLLGRVQDVVAEIHEPAVVLFRFQIGSDIQEEPVYNWDVAWPDDAPIIRAHDLGGRDVELLNYYQSRQPRRMFYLFNRADGSLTKLGNAEEAARVFASRDKPRGH